MWTVKFVSRDNEQACAVNEEGDEVWFTWYLAKIEGALRDCERLNATNAIHACNAQKAGGCRSYLDAEVDHARDMAGLLLMQIDACEQAIAENNLGDVAVASCEMKDTARDLVQLHVNLRNHNEASRVHYGNAATDGRWRD